jgi:hypothetical protein
MGRTLLLFLSFSLLACEKDQEPESHSPPSFSYSFNEGQNELKTAYTGDHPRDLRAEMQLLEGDSGGTRIRITFSNTLDGETYAVHAHDYDADSTIGLPYEFSVNTAVLNQNPVGRTGTLEIEQHSDSSVAYFENRYQGYLVVHDPLQPVQTKKPSSFLILGRFAR